MDLVEQWLFDPVIGKLVAAVVGVAVIYAVARLLRRNLVSRVVKRGPARELVRKTVSTIGYVVALLYLIGIFSDSLGQITVVLGVAGAGIAFALQEVIASFAGWATLTLGRFYKVGDRIQLGGIKGDVIDIGMLRTTVVEVGEWVKGDLYTGRVVRIANSFVFKQPVFNYSGDFPFLWDEITIPVKYGSNRQLVRELLTQSVQDVAGSYIPEASKAWDQMRGRFTVENASVEPMVSLVANDNWLEYTVRYVVDFRRRRSVKDALFNRILDAFDTADGRVSVASTTIQLVDLPPIQVTVGDQT